MTQSEAARVFDRFWRADPARARTTGGSGLGLSIAAEDTKLHNGWLQAWGSKGTGSNFRLTLPLKQGDAIVKSPLQLEPADVALPGSTGQGTMLLFGTVMPPDSEDSGPAAEPEPDRPPAASSAVKPDTGAEDAK
jgi:two-component system sensor histidine kinase MtrB